MDSTLNTRMSSSSYGDFVRNARFCGMPGGPVLDDPAYYERNLRRKENHIYFYDIVDQRTQLIFFQLMQDIIRENMSAFYLKDGFDPIVIHINSPGGSAHCGLAIYDFIKNCRVPVTTISEGIAGSAAGLIFLAGNRRIVSENSCVLLHQPSWGCDGQNRLMQDMALNVEKIFDRMIRIIAAETRIGLEEYEDPKERYDYIRRLCEHDYELDETECKVLGVATAVKVEPRLTAENEKKVDELVEKLLKEQDEADLKAKKEEIKVQKKEAKTKKSVKKNSKETEATK